MNYKIAVYTTDYLLLLELTAAIEREYPLSDVVIFGDDVLEESLNAAGEGYIVKDFSQIHDHDILIILSDPQAIYNEAEKFDGTIVDTTGTVFPKDTEVYAADEPVRRVLKNLAIPLEDVSVVAELPVCVFGKNGVEDLMRQTREIFAFEESDNLVFEKRIAFNVHFNPENLVLSSVTKSVDAFTAAGGDINVRIAPISTVFIIDAYAKDTFDLKNHDGYKMTKGFFTISDVSECGEIFVIKRRNGYTFTGDYIRVLVETVIKKLKEVMGQ